MAIFRPTCRVRLQLSLDEGARSTAPSVAATKKWLQGTPGDRAIDTALAANLDKRVGVGALAGVMSPPNLALARQDLDFERAQLEQMQSKGKQTYPSGVDPSQGERSRSVVFTAIPMSAVITRAPTKDADTAQLIFDFRVLPIDPRCVRSALVIIDLGAVDSESYVAGMLGGQTRADGSSLALIGHDDRQELKVYSTTRYIGFCARWKVVYDEGGDTLSMDCVDISTVMRTQPLLGHKIDLSKPVDEGVQEVIDSFVTSNGIQVIAGTPVDPSDLTSVQKPTGSLIPADVMPVALKQKAGRGKRAGSSPKTVTGNGVVSASQKSEKQTVWDHINDVALRLGLVPVMRGFTLYLLEPRLLFRNLENAKRMVYGKNIKHLEMERKMEGITTDTIEIRCPDRSIGRVRWARYPVLQGEPRSGILGMKGSPQPVFSRASKLTPNGTGHEVVRVLTVRGVAQLATLEKIAESTFHEIGRQEIQGQFLTDEIDSWQAKTDADLLDLWPGDPITLLVESASNAPEINGATSLQQLQSMSVAERQTYLQTQGISQEAAKRLAEAQEKIWLTSTFRVGYLTLRWSNEEGVTIEGDYYNFIVIREDPDAQTEAPQKRPTKLSEAMGMVK